ncbi:hypothetical protein BJX66DRAFT_335128 [Aspergillus keveii]|uniref:Uncharacterized protein n=1 Tax=Aspergillus keveii TaxID=714993 RepID=A0ABR4GE09_9EURO
MSFKARPALNRSLSSSSSISGGRPFSIAIPARLANESRLLLQPRGYLAEKGPFPFRERATSYESIHTASVSASGLSSSADVETLRAKNPEQRRKIEALQRAMSELAKSGGNEIAGQED